MAPARPPRRRPSTRTTFATRSPRLRPVVIVGFGRVGGALALGLQRAGWPVSVFPRSGASIRSAVAHGVRVADQEDLREASAVVLAVPDDSLSEAAALVAGDLGRTTALVHCSGALPLSILAGHGDRPLGSLHPLAALSARTDSLEGRAAALSATTPGLLSLLRRACVALGLKPFAVPEAGRTAYHAGAVFAAGGLVALASAAVEALGEAGVPGPQALAALIPLMRSALDGVEARGLSAGLTGPIARGDREVVRAHLAALPPELVPLYRALGRRGVDLARARLPRELAESLAALLREPQR
jgi:predicted short-subunit dehydrogenase-like oxidoreductase (DUF2520 family)